MVPMLFPGEPVLTPGEPVLTPDEMAAADRRAIAGGVPEHQLIERAGTALAFATRELLGGAYGRRVVALCGKGNNGADGRVAAAVLERMGVRADVIDIATGVDHTLAERLVGRADAVIDAMFGTGFRGTLEGDAAWLVEFCERADRPIVAADVPSGVDGATGAIASAAVRADRTVCFQAWKPGLLFEPGRSHAGEVAVVDLGIPVGASTHVVTAADVIVAPRPSDAHKWSRSVLVVGGSSGMTGAPLLCGRAALRSGAGMVVAALPTAAPVAPSGAEIVVRPLPADPDGSFAAEAAARAVRDAVRFGAVVVGPGLGRSLGADSLAARIAAEVDRPLVIDADALNVLADDRSPLRIRRTAGLPRPVLTPHAGEYARLAGNVVGSDRISAARALAAATASVVLLKGPGTVVADESGRAVVVRAGGPSLATAGTGDVLSGIIGALLASGLDPFDAAWTAAVAQATAAEMVPFGDGTVASDVIDALPLAFAKFR